MNCSTDSALFTFETEIAVGSLQYDFARIRAATNDFSFANKVGQGGFGSVYKVIESIISVYKKHTILIG